MARPERSLPHGMGKAVESVERNHGKVLLGGSQKTMGHASEGMGQRARTSRQELCTLRIRCQRQLSALERSLESPTTATG